MSHDRAMQVNQHRTFLQPQGLDHGQHQHQHPLHEPASPCTMATEGVFPPQHAQAQDSFRMIVRGLDSLDRREHPNAGYSAKRLTQKVAALESAQERPCSKMPWSSRDRVQPGLQARSVQFATAKCPSVGEPAFHWPDAWKFRAEYQ